MSANSKSGVKGSQKAKTKLIEMNSTLTSLAKEMRELSANVKAMMDGDTDGPYWNGNKAKKFYKQAITNITNNIEDYCDAYRFVDIAAANFVDAVNKDKK